MADGTENQEPMLPPYTVRQAMSRCGIDDTMIFNDKTAAHRLASDIFSDSFEICMDKTIDEVKSELKQYSNLTPEQGQIITTPGNVNKIQAFIQWTHDMIRIGLEPSSGPFPVENTAVLLKNYKSHKAYLEKTKTITDAAKPSKFKENMKWEDWCPTFINFLRSIPGRNGVPLSYICREFDKPMDYNPAVDFIENYVTQAPLYGEAYAIDAAEVHTYLVNYMSGNTTAEVNLLPHVNANDGRRDFKSLKDHYEGVGVNAVGVLEAEETIRSLHYSGEKKPHMWWDEFEKKLTHAFTIMDKKERRTVYSDEMKLRMLAQKINVDFLQPIKSAINVELTKTPVTMTYDQALMTFRNEVNWKFPPTLTPLGSRTRQVNEVSTGYPRQGASRGGRGRTGGRGGRSQGRGGRGGRGRGARRRRSRGHPDARWVTGTDGRSIEVHPSYNFPPQVWNVLPQNEIAGINNERQQYRGNKRQRVSEVGTIPPAINVPDTTTHAHTNNSVISNVSTQHQGGQPSIMGGRNSHASMHTRNTGSQS